MKNILKLAAVAAVAFALTQTVQAVPVTGSIGFTGGVTIDKSSMGSATEVTSWVSPIVLGTSGSFATVPNFTPTTFSGVWQFASGPIASFWSVGGFTFNLVSSYVVSQGFGAGGLGYVVVNGSGMVSGNGYSSTYMSWSFTSQDPKSSSSPDTWTFSASANTVPDGGATVILLGIALSGAALLRKRLTA
jgi:hypothetical protein